MLKPGQNLHLRITFISYTFVLKFILLLLLYNVTEDNSVCSFLWLCYFNKRFGTSFWGEEKGKVQRSATIQQLQSWCKTHPCYDGGATLSPATTSTVQVPWHLACLPKLFFRTLGDWVFSRIRWIWPFPNTPHLQCKQGVWALAPELSCDSSAGWAWHREGCACWCSSVLRTTLGNLCSLPQRVTQRTSSTLLTRLHLQDLMGAIFYVETLWRLVILAVSGNKADTLLGNPF